MSDICIQTVILDVSEMTATVVDVFKISASVECGLEFVMYVSPLVIFQDGVQIIFQDGTEMIF